jgi:hypothetical protein
MVVLARYPRLTVKIFTILRPVRQTGETFAFIPYCLTEKGKALLDQKTGTQP